MKGLGCVFKFVSHLHLVIIEAKDRRYCLGREDGRTEL